MPPFDLQGAIVDSANKHGVDPSFALSVARAESGMNPNIRDSPKGAAGTFQIMEPTAKDLGINRRDVRQNVDGGVRYLRQQLDRFGGDQTLAAAAYNAGPEPVERHGGVPPYPETQAYVAKVMKGVDAAPPSADDIEKALASGKTTIGTPSATTAASQSAAAAPQSQGEEAPPLEQHIIPSSDPNPSGIRQITPDAKGQYRDSNGTLYTREGEFFTDPKGAKYTVTTGQAAEEAPPPDIADVEKNLGGNLGQSISAEQRAWLDAHPATLKPYSALDALGNTVGAGLRSVANTASLGFADKGAAALEAFTAPQYGGDYAGRFSAALGRQNEASNVAQAAHPVASALGAIPGVAAQVVALPVTGGPITQAAIGGALSGLNAAGHARGDIAEMAPKVIPAAIGGTIAGGVLGMATAPAKAGADVLAGVHPDFPVRPSIAGRAAEYVAGKLGAEDPQMIAAAQAGKDVTLAEMLGPNGRLALKTLGRQQGATGTALAEKLADRSASAPQMIADDFATASGVDPAAAKGDLISQVDAKRASMGPKYQALMESPAPVMNEELSGIAKRPAVQSAMKMAATSLRNAGKDPTAIGITDQGPPVVSAQQYQEFLKTGDEAALGGAPRTVPTLEAWDMTKKALADSVKRDDFNRVITQGEAGRFNRDINTASRDLTSALKEAVPGYKELLAGSGDYIKQQQAFEMGQDHVFNPKVTVADGKKFFDGLSPAEQDAYRSGIANAVFDKAQRGTLTPKVFSPPIVQGKLEYALPEGASGDFLSSVQHVRRMQGAASEMVPSGGSPTTPMREEISAQNAGGGRVRRIAGEMAGDVLLGSVVGHGPVGGISYALGRQGIKAATAAGDLLAGRMSPAVRDEAGRILMSKMTPDELRTYIAQIKAMPGAIHRPVGIPLSQAGLGDYLGTPDRRPTTNALQGLGY